jgi:hypothetical protein
MNMSNSLVAPAAKAILAVTIAARVVCCLCFASMVMRTKGNSFAKGRK